MGNNKTTEKKLLALLKANMKNQPVVTEENFKLLKSKKYDSGKKIKIGDTIGFGLMKKESPENEILYKLFTFHIDEIGKKYVFDTYDKLPNKKESDSYFFKFKFVEKE